MARKQTIFLNKKQIAELRTVISGQVSTATKKAQAILMINRGLPETEIIELTGYSKRHTQVLQYRRCEPFANRIHPCYSGHIIKYR